MKKEKKDGRLSRSSFLKQSGLAFMGLASIFISTVKASSLSSPSTVPRRDDKTLRTIAYNVFNGGIGYRGVNDLDLPEGEEYHLLKQAREKAQIPTRIAMELALYDADIINFSEGPDRDVVKMIADYLGMDYVYCTSTYLKGSFPGAILTRYEIVDFEDRPFVNKDDDKKELFTRHWGRAILKLPNDRLLSVHSAHLYPNVSDNAQEVRFSEIKELLKSINHDLGQDKVDSVLIQGDLNHVPAMPEYGKLNEETKDLFEIGKGEGNTIPSYGPQRRIDYIRVKGALERRMKKYKVLNEGAFRIYREAPQSYALSDHLPVLGEFEI